jgi:hypothetical protein
MGGLPAVKVSEQLERLLSSAAAEDDHPDASDRGTPFVALI